MTLRVACTQEMALDEQKQNKVVHREIDLDDLENVRRRRTATAALTALTASGEAPGSVYSPRLVT